MVNECVLVGGTQIKVNFGYILVVMVDIQHQFAILEIQIMMTL